MKVKKITVKNLKSVSEMTANFDWCTAIITGGNNKWKTTFLRSFVDRIQGKINKNVLKTWEKDWYCEYELTDWSKFIWELSQWKEKLSYITTDWITIKNGIIKEFSKRFFWEWFDIDKFLTSHPKEQRQLIQKIIWIDMSDLDKRYLDAYEDRADKNSIYKSEQAKCNDLVVIEMEDKKDLSKIQNKMIEIEKQNQDIYYVTKWLEEKEKSKKEIEKKIEELNKKYREIWIEIEKWKKYLSGVKVESVEDIKKQYEDGKDHNDRYEQNEFARKQLKNLELVKKEYEQAGLNVKSIEEERLQILKSADIPEWFEVTNDWLLYNWFELDKKQLSSSSIYIASLKLASMWLWEIKTLCFDASYLDKNSLWDIETRAERNNLQLLIERPDYDWWEIKYEIVN